MADQREQYTNPKYYQNRELSWLQFDRRCLSEARNKDNPLFERLKFLSITASNRAVGRDYRRHPQFHAEPVLDLQPPASSRTS